MKIKVDENNHIAEEFDQVKANAAEKKNLLDEPGLLVWNVLVTHHDFSFSNAPVMGYVDHEVSGDGKDASDKRKEKDQTQGQGNEQSSHSTWSKFAQPVWADDVDETQDCHQAGHDGSN